MPVNQLHDYHEAGFRVFPLWGIDAEGKCSCSDPECTAPGKHPFVNAWQSTPYYDDDQIEMMQEHLVTTGFGVCLDNHLVVDVDPRNDGYKSLENLCHDIGVDLRMASGFIVTTGGGGEHIYFNVPPNAQLMMHHKKYPGIDFKCGTRSGSFVVGGGSLHASGLSYDFDKGNPDDLVEAPPELLGILKREERVNKSVDGIEVDDGEIAAALDFLSPNVEHDEWIRIGMAIHDGTHGEGFHLWDGWSSTGDDYPGSSALERRWHSFGKHSNPVKIATLFHMAAKAGYIRPVTFENNDPPPSSDDGETAEAEAPPKPKHVRMLDALLANDDAEMMRVANMAWLIDGLIPAESFGVVFGEPGCGKSFTMVDMACSVASGKQWQGLDTGDEGIVVYISAEGGNGMRFRKRAWEQVNCRAPLMRVLPITTIIDDPKDVGQLTQVLREYRKRIGQPIKMVVVDTLNRSMAGNENDNSEMADFVRGCELIQRDHGCGVVVVHHSGKDAERGARGASSLKAATDFEIMVSKKEDIITVSNTRAKDVEPLSPVLCRTEVVTIDGYTDYKGRPITSLVPLAASFGDEMRASLHMTEREEMLLAIVRKHAAEAGADDGSCLRSDVRKNFMEMTGMSGHAGTQALSHNLKSLKEKGKIEYDREEIRLTEF